MSAQIIIETLRSVLSGHVSDAMEQLQLPRSVILGLRVAGLGDTPMVGPACTLQQRRKPPGTSRELRLVRHGELTRGGAKAGEVIVIATGGIVDVATWGENHARRCRQFGIVGVLTDGATRDVCAVERTGVPAFFRATSPVKSQWDLETVAIRQSVVIADVVIAPGDIIFGDDSGLLVLPAQQALEIARLASDIRRAEKMYGST